MPVVLFGWTAVTGVVDAVSYLALLAMARPQKRDCA